MVIKGWILMEFGIFLYISLNFLIKLDNELRWEIKKIGISWKEKLSKKNPWKQKSLDLDVYLLRNQRAK